MIKKLLMLFTLPIMIVTLISCVSSAKYDVVATLYPQYDMARYISGDELSVKLILPYGMSPHDFEPTSAEMKMIEDASLILLTSYELEPWLLDVGHDNKADLGEFIGEYKPHDEHDGDDHDEHDGDDHDEHDGDDHDEHDGDDHDEHDGDDHDEHDGDDHDDQHDHDHDHDHADIHFWTHPEAMKAMVSVIAEELVHLSLKRDYLWKEKKNILKKLIHFLRSYIYFYRIMKIQISNYL